MTGSLLPDADGTPVEQLLDDDDLAVIRGEQEAKTRRSLCAALDLDAIQASTEERKAQAERLRDTTRDAASWNDYCRSVRYFDGVLAVIEEARRGR